MKIKRKDKPGNSCREEYILAHEGNNVKKIKVLQKILTNVASNKNSVAQHDAFLTICL